MSNTWTRKDIMDQLHITEDEIHTQVATEKLYSAAVLSAAGTDVAARIFGQYNELKAILRG
jgi:hypothetical protein